eukprot:TRINITY_DN21949_c0_g1_i1.p1 TRINITY_DN21949_c0_g1~~TRINITY_DN21949_c0_g1_i1.p1  ORF type:complete len:184 (+),score=66.72 TRINITY_DN21949_c0_g1_i1:391-942(+)
MTPQEIEKEKQEFEAIYKKATGKIEMKPEPEVEQESAKPPQTKQEELLQRINELQKKIDKDRNQRKVEDWVPDKLLCRRFGFDQPHKDKPWLHVKKDKEKKPTFEDKFDRGESLLDEERLKQARQTLKEEDFKLPKAFVSKATRNEVEEEPKEEDEELGQAPAPVPDRPSLDVFKSIFGDDSD